MNKSPAADRAAMILVLVYGLGLAWLTVLRFHNLTLFIGDHATISQLLWSTLHGKFMATTTGSHFYSTDGPVNFLAFHFAPIYLLLVPFFAFLPIAAALAALKCLLMAAAGWALYKLSRQVLGPWEAFIPMALFLASPPVVGSVHDSFHGDYFAPLFIFLSLLNYHRKRFGAFMFFALLLLMSKESYAPSVFMMGAYAWMDKRRGRWIWAPSLLALTWMAAYFFVWQPYFYAQTPPLVQNDWKAVFLQGLSPGVLFEAFFHGFRDDAWYFTSGAKFFTFLHPSFILWLPEMLIHKAMRLSYEGHYGITLTAFVFASLPFALKRLENSWNKKRLLPIILIFGLISSYESFKPLNPKNFRPNPLLTVQREALGLIPRNASVSANDLYLAHLADREKLDWLGHEEYLRRYEYVLIDLNRANNEHIEWPLVEGYWKKRLESPDYTLLFDKENIRLYRLQS